MINGPQVWTVKGNVAYIELRDQRVLIDADAVPLVSMYRWHMDLRGYVKSSFGNTTYRLHRVVMGLDLHDPREVDHRDHKLWDNRRSELRIATRADNCRNMRPRKGRIGYKGVTPHKKRFAAQLRFEGRTLYLGLFKSDVDAAKAYDAAALKHFGEFAHLNFPVVHGPICEKTAVA